MPRHTASKTKVAVLEKVAFSERDKGLSTEVRTHESNAKDI